jgi:hypothetical protein
MPSLGGAHLLVVVVLVVLVFDSRRFHGLARTVRGSDPDRAIPPGGNPDRVGLTLRQIQMRQHVDWQDGGIAWAGPEVLPDETPAHGSAEPEANPALPVLWQPFLALPAASDVAA